MACPNTNLDMQRQAHWLLFRKDIEIKLLKEKKLKKEEERPGFRQCNGLEKFLMMKSGY